MVFNQNHTLKITLLFLSTLTSVLWHIFFQSKVLFGYKGKTKIPENLPVMLNKTIPQITYLAKKSYLSKSINRYL